MSARVMVCRAVDFATLREEAGLCARCEIVVINGVRCHEAGCPDSWKDTRRECRWCGAEFTPESVHQQFCTEECREDFNS